MSEYKLSIITPTYNRGYILGTLYDSLCRQTIKAFEWVIVDDGSTDHTEDLVSNWLADDKGFQVKYVKQQNGGKHRALNRGIPLAQYEYIYIIDSDDQMDDYAVERIYNWIDIIEDKPDFAGVAGLRVSPDGAIIGQYPIGKKYVDATSLERRKFQLIGDKAEVYKKDILIKYPFPEFQNEKFLEENAVWYMIAADGYKLRWFGETICICEYLADGLTMNTSAERILNNFEGYSFVEKLNVKLMSFPQNYLAVGRYYDNARKKGLSIEMIKTNLEINYAMLLGGRVARFIRKILLRGRL